MGLDALGWGPRVKVTLRFLVLVGCGPRIWVVVSNENKVFEEGTAALARRRGIQKKAISDCRIGHPCPIFFRSCCMYGHGARAGKTGVNYVVMLQCRRFVRGVQHIRGHETG
jgi:hypothetical protein